MTVDVKAPRVVEPGARLAERFVIGAQLGAGAFGTVYAAEDVASGRIVAVKHLTRVDGATIYRFKKEFRTLADREHPNLVRFHELFNEDGGWFFSMELVEGVHLDRWVLGPREHPQEAPTEPNRAPGAAPRDSPARPDLDKLRAALSQLVAAIRELHGAGVVHRDLKPANVLVTREGRVVVLDFGLATETDPDAQQSVLGIVMGTPTYMSPEQALGRAATEASDWYSLGVMLFEVLYGRTPFSGTLHDVLTAKLSPSTWRWPTPSPEARDLDDLCRALLQPEAALRPTGEEVARLTAARPFVPGKSSAPTPHGFFGRAREQRALTEALTALDASRTVVMRVHGHSGVGKTALIRHFVQSLDGGDVVVLQGRCYERESVPYKTLDGVVDALTRHLGRLSVAEASLLVPREAQALCRLFPVFARLRLLAEQPERHRSSSPHEERRRGFAALREVLARIGDRRRLIVTIDDLQWGDVDSIEPLSELLAGPDPPRVLLLLAYRSNDEPHSPVLRALREQPFLAAGGDVRELEVGPLDDADAVALAQSLLPASEHSRARELAKESGGIPFFVPELVRAQRKTHGAPIVSLEEVMRYRVSLLSAGARRLLEVVAVAGRPVPRGVACAAARLDDGEHLLAADELVREHFLRTAAQEDSSLETFHDRVRESVVAALSEEHRRATHEALAAALSAAGRTDPEALAEHYRLAGKLAEARPAAVEAAERATHAFAFERAVALYRVAQEGAPSSERRLLTSKLADVLAYAGRGREAAAAYLEAVVGAEPKEARALRRRAAEQLLRSGAVAEGIALSRTLLDEAGISYPESRNALLASLIAQKARLALRGTAFKERALGPADDDDASRVDLLYAVGSVLSSIDIVRGADLQTRHLRHALDLGDPYRIARALSIMAISLSAEGGRAHEKAEQVTARALEVARRIDHPHAIGTALSAHSSVNWCAARWRRSLQYSHELTVVFRDRCPEAVWELVLADILLTARSLFFLGELEEFTAEAERCSRAAVERGDDLVFAMSQSVGMTKVHLLRDRPSEARQATAEGIARWSQSEWHLAHQEDLRAQLLCDVYEGEGRRGLERVAASWKSMQSSLLLHAETERVQSFSLIGSAAILAGDRKAAAHWLAKLAKEKHPWGQACAQGVRAGVLAMNGAPEAAAAYEQAALRFEALEMPLHTAAARRRRGELSGAEGAELVEATDASLRARGVVDPARFSRMLVT